jgi:hypothetical protein
LCKSHADLAGQTTSNLPCAITWARRPVGRGREGGGGGAQCRCIHKNNNTRIATKAIKAKRTAAQETRRKRASILNGEFTTVGLTVGMWRILCTLSRSQSSHSKNPPDEFNIQHSD